MSQQIEYLSGKQVCDDIIESPEEPVLPEATPQRVNSSAVIQAGQTTSIH